MPASTRPGQAHRDSSGITGRRKPRGRRQTGGRLVPYLFLLPALIPYTIFVIYPIADSMLLSLYSWDGMSAHKRFVGLDNFTQTLTGDSVFWLSLGNNVKWTVVALLLPVLLGFLFAAYFGRPQRGFGIYRATIYFPAVLSTVMVSQIWSWVYDPNYGMVNALLKVLTNGRSFLDWMANPDHVIYYVTVAASWGYVGFCMLLFINGMRSIPEELYEAAFIDGATKMQALRYITIPMLRNTSNIVITSTVIFSFQVFDYIILMTNGGPGRSTSVAATWAYTQFFNYYSVGKATAIAILLGLIVLGPAVVSQRLAARATDY